MRSKGGFTLIEISVASVMAVLVFGVILRIFWFARKVEREARSSYLVREDVDVAFRNLQEELRMTHLASIRVGSDKSSFSMASPIKNNELASFELTPFGVAKWKSWAHFTIQGGDDNTGELVRWEAAVPEETTLPNPSKLDPTNPVGSKWSVVKGVVKPGRGVVTGSDAERTAQLGDVPDNSGLQLRFVRYENGAEMLSTVNPAQNHDGNQPGWSQGTTRLVDCRLQVGDISSESGKLSLYTLNFRVKPRN